MVQRGTKHLIMEKEVRSSGFNGIVGRRQDSSHKSSLTLMTKVESTKILPFLAGRCQKVPW